MKFNLIDSIEILDRTPSILKVLLKDLPDDWTASNEGGDSWSPYDVVGHLVHGERTDWIPRTMIIMNDSEQKTFTPYDRFAQFRESKGKSLVELLDSFEDLRSKNLEILKGLHLTDTDLQRKGIHPELGPVTLSNMLSAWVVHDLGHITQVCRVMAKQYKDEAGPWTKYMTILNNTPNE